MFRNFEYMSTEWAIFFLVASVASGSVSRVAVDDVGCADVVRGVSSVRICVLDVI